MFRAALIAMNAMSILAEEKAFQEQVIAMPEDQRSTAIQSRKDWKQALQQQREHEAMVEAAKPHTLWSFLGLGRK